MIKSKKVSATSKRVVETLKLLSDSPSSIQEIISYFERTDPENRIYTHEVILKYINTLKVFGLKFVKDRDKYVLLNTILKLDFSEKELEALKLVENLSKSFPEENVKFKIDEFLQEMERFFSDETRLISHNIRRNDCVNFAFDYGRHALKVKEYEKYCIDAQRIKVTFKNNNGAQSSIMLEPIEIKYEGNEVFLRGHNPVSAQIRDVSFDSIVKVEQLPLKSNQKTISYSMTFELKDRLAKAYKLREGEEVIQIKPDGAIVILNKSEDKCLLLKRLMRYGELCEVISPKTLREEMREMIIASLSNYSIEK